MLLSQCNICRNKKSRFIKPQEAKRLLNSLGIKTLLSKIPLLNVLFQSYTMNDMINRLLLKGDKFMPEMHLRDPIVGAYSACGPFSKNKQRIQSFLETGDTSYIYKNELNKACFQHDMAYGDFKYLKRRTQSDKLLKDKAFEIASNPKYDG